MSRQLKVDKTWCSKCKICRSASEGVITFDADGYPVEKPFFDADLRAVEKALEKCPARVLVLV